MSRKDYCDLVQKRIGTGCISMHLVHENRFELLLRLILHFRVSQID